MIYIQEKNLLKYLYILECGGRFTAPEGAIFSPNYPNNFDRNDTCFWLIEVDENHAIELLFDDADLPTNCDHNYIKVKIFYKYFMYQNVNFLGV